MLKLNISFRYLNKNSLFFLFVLLFSFSLFSQNKAKITGTISDQFGSLPGAKVTIEGSNISTTSDVNGDYVLNIEAGDLVINVAFIMYKTATKLVSVKPGEEAILDFTLETGFSIDQPVSLGSRAKPSSLLKTTAPVDIISPQDITNSPQIELSHILHYLVPSFHSTNQTISDGTDHIDPATLRGLGPDQILVLVNGKRRHNSSLLNVNGTVGKGTVGTDFNAIPVASIERIEILRDGATSQYGSDAIAGVINIILKKQTQSIDLQGRSELTTEGDGLTTYFSANFGFVVGKKGFINITGEYRNREAYNRAGDYNGSVYSKDPEEDAILIAENNFYSQNEYSGKRVMEIGNASTQNLALSFNGEFPISNNSLFYFHGGRNYREGKSKGFYRFPNEVDRVVLELFPDGFSPEILTDIQDDAISLGFRGEKNEWNLDFSHTIGINTLDYTVNNSNNASLGFTSPRTFYSGGFSYKQNTSNLDVSRAYDWLYGVNIAFGAELRVENYNIIAGEEDSYLDGDNTYIDSDGIEQQSIAGAQVFPGIQPENELSRFRTNSSGYIDVEVNTSKETLLKATARYEAYNDFGAQFIWKLSGRYKITEDLNFRVGLSTGFRAPSLHQVYFQNISTQFINGDIVQVGTFNNESAVAKEAFHIKNLKPELSNHFNAGFSGKLAKNVSFTADYYNIKIKDRIVLSGRFDEGYEETLEPFNVGAAQFFTNAIDTKTIGLDVAVHYKNKIGNGEFNASLAGNINKTEVIQLNKVSDFLEGQESTLFNREDIARVESAQPNYKINSILSYHFDKYNIQLGNTFFGKVEYVHPDDELQENWVVNEFSGGLESRDQTFSSKLVTDLALSYTFEKICNITLGGTNIFNVYPDKHAHSANTENGNFIYSRRVQQFGVKGSNYYIRLLLKL
ncbi:TonB-dependent receptor plug domain-containing protein [Lacinutrix sp. WUR7]|uniref:TonB-dependent receptor n=1 Tax=Lacinutrix sp. WUR7 TaxID=2653681 RepID=UPI00193E86FA|nr:TonB-dependent receptor [Lacinutrix sp. WUR7]QRM90653.1 TonB-dependent receptor plug domain-containing protein [Lacinutrix sp. WUR7]